MISKSLVFTCLAVLLIGCSREEYRGADNRVLCDPNTNQAYYIKEGVGDTSFVRRNPSLDKVCANKNDTQTK